MNNLLVDSSPSKEFFINMITKDVTVESCILDLIDNSIDSHKKKKRDQTSEIDIRFSMEKDFFSINDNCGGMTKEIAKNKAFRFGNRENRVDGTLGMYGIGMKRSIFKIGKNFLVESKTDTDSFKVYMDQKEWLDLKDEGNMESWKFHLDDYDLTFENGVHITINQLNDSFKAYLKWSKNIVALKQKIASAYKEVIKEEVTIRVNGERIVYSSDVLYESDNLKSYINTINTKTAKIKIIAGIGTPSPRDAGWNIICNGRTVIEKDRTELTGWESSYSIDDDSELDMELEKGGKTIPAFHNDFARFRGYVYIESENANELPLNTTKDGIDRQHPIYELIYNEMISIMKQILPSLRKLQEVVRNCKNEMTVPPTESFSSKTVLSLYGEKKSSFCLRLDDYKAPEKIKNIPMYIQEKDVKKLKQFFEADTNKDLGNKMLEFVMERVILDE